MTTTTEIRAATRADGEAIADVHIASRVLRDNPRLRAFCERHGWSATGVEADFDACCAVDVPEVEYRKEFA